jgi:hypothetical protein
MKNVLKYRSYRVANEDGRYTAKSLDGEPGAITSSFLLRILRCVDVLWDALELPVEHQPLWVRSFLNDSEDHLDVDQFEDVPSPLPKLVTVDVTPSLMSHLRFPSIPVRPSAIVAKIGAAAAALSVSLHPLMDMLDPIIDAFDVIAPALA